MTPAVVIVVRVTPADIAAAAADRRGGPLAAALARLGYADVGVQDPDGGVLSALAGDLEPDVACAALVADGVRVRGLRLERPSLEDAFVALTGEGFDVAG